MEKFLAPITARFFVHRHLKLVPGEPACFTAGGLSMKSDSTRDLDTVNSQLISVVYLQKVFRGQLLLGKWRFLVNVIRWQHRAHRQPRVVDGLRGSIFQIFGTDPERSLRLEPSTCKLLSKQSSLKWTEHIKNFPLVSKIAWWRQTNLTHLSRSLFIDGLECIEMPAWRSDSLLQLCTTQRYPGMTKSGVLV